MKKLKIIKNIFLSKFFNLQRPIQVSFAITNKCNLKCIYCYGNYHCIKEKDFSLEELKKIFTYLKKKGLVQIYLTGGEPLLRNDIDDIVVYLKKLGINIGLITNGLLVQSKLDVLKKVNNVLVSIDGDEKENDLNRGKGTHKKIISTLDLFKKNNIKFSLKCVFNKNNINQLDYLVNLAEKYNTEIETIIPYEHFGEKSQFLSIEQKKELFKKILQYVKEEKPIKFNYKTHKMSFDVFSKYQKDTVFNEKLRKYPKCIAGKLYLFINANGDVYPCNSIIGKFKPLNIHKAGIGKAIKHTLTNECTLCSIPFLNEKKYLASLNPKIILNYIKGIN